MHPLSGGRRHRFARRSAAALSILFAAGCAALGAPSGSPRDGICEAIWVPVDDARLYVLARGRHRQAPVLVWLHGGPGAAERPLFRLFNRELEGHFVVAYWDQRGAGRSFDEDADPARLTIRQHLEDLDRVVDHLRAAFGEERVALLGHSWGSALGLMYARDHPEKVIAFIGTGQVVSTLEAERAQLAFLETEAQERDESELRSLLERVGPPPFDWDEDLALQRWIDRYGGVFHRSPSRWGVVFGAIARGYARPWEIHRLIRANAHSLAAMNYELRGLDLPSAVPSVAVPVLFVLGRHDRVTDPSLAREYLARLRAPRKSLLWFEGSAHNAPFEEPDRFNASVIDFLRELTSGGKPGSSPGDPLGAVETRVSRASPWWTAGDPTRARPSRSPGQPGSAGAAHRPNASRGVVGVRPVSLSSPRRERRWRKDP